MAINPGMVGLGSASSAMIGGSPDTQTVYYHEIEQAIDAINNFLHELAER